MLRNLIQSLLTKGSVALINFFILILSSRYLGVSSRGEISIFVLNIAIIQIINEVYTGYSIIHFLPKYNLRKIVGFGLFYTFLFCSVSNSIVIFLNKQLPGYEWIGYCVSLLVISNTFNCVIILGKENIKLYNILSFIQPFLLLLGLIFYLFILRKYTFISFVFPLFFSFTAAFILSTITVIKLIFKESKSKEYALKPILMNGFLFQTSSLMFLFANKYNYYLLPESASVGLYSSASSLMESVLIIVNAVSPLLLARVAKQGDTIKSADMALSLSKASFILSILATLIIFILPEGVFVFVLGVGFAGIKGLMLIYAPGVVLVSLFAVISNYFLALGKQKLLVLCYGLGLISTVLLAPVLIKEYGMYGAAYNANITYLIMAIAVSYAFMKINKISLYRFFSFKTDLKNLKNLMVSP